MIIKSLCDYFDILEKRNEIDFGYSEEPVGAIISISSNSGKISVLKADKGYTQKVPNPQKDDGGVWPNFLFGSSEYLCGIFEADKKDLLTDDRIFFYWDDDEDEIAFNKKLESIKENKRNIYIKHQNNCRKRFEAMRNLIDCYFPAGEDTASNTLNNFIHSGISDNIKKIDLDWDENRDIICNSGGKIVLMIDDTFVYDFDIVRNAYKTYLEKNMLNCEEKTKKRCMCCGQMGRPCDKHLAFTGGLPEWLVSGAKLITYKETANNISSEEDYFNKTPICTSCMVKYVSALKYLMKHRGNEQITKKDGTTFNRFDKRYDIDKNTMLVYFSNVKNDFFEGIFTRTLNEETFSDEEFNSLLKNLYNSENAAEKINGTPSITIIEISGNMGRLAVNSFSQNSMNYFINNIKRYYGIFNYNGSVPGLFFIKKENLASKYDIERLIKAIVEGGRYPVGLYEKCIKKSFKIRDNGIDIWYAKTILSIINGYLKINKGGNNNLKTDNEQIAYNLGKWLASADKIYGNAKSIQNNGNNSNYIYFSQKYFELLRDSPKRGIVIFSTAYQRMVKQFGNRYPRLFHNDNSFVDLGEAKIPDRFSLDEKAQFILGFYEQKNRLWNKRKNNKNDEINNNEEEQIDVE